MGSIMGKILSTQLVNAPFWRLQRPWYVPDPKLNLPISIQINNIVGQSIVDHSINQSDKSSLQVSEYTFRLTSCLGPRKHGMYLTKHQYTLRKPQFLRNCQHLNSPTIFGQFVLVRRKIDIRCIFVDELGIQQLKK